jgi:hypothetical protein
MTLERYALVLGQQQRNIGQRANRHQLIGSAACISASRIAWKAGFASG